MSKSNSSPRLLSDVDLERMRPFVEQASQHGNMGAIPVAEVARKIIRQLDSAPAVNGYDQIRILAESGLYLLYLIRKRMESEGEPQERIVEALTQAADTIVSCVAATTYAMLDILVNKPEDADAVEEQHVKAIREAFDRYNQDVVTAVMLHHSNNDATC